MTVRVPEPDSKIVQVWEVHKGNPIKHYLLQVHGSLYAGFIDLHTGEQLTFQEARKRHYYDNKAAALQYALVEARSNFNRYVDDFCSLIKELLLLEPDAFDQMDETQRDNTINSLDIAQKRIAEARKLLNP